MEKWAKGSNDLTFSIEHHASLDEILNEIFKKLRIVIFQKNSNFSVACFKFKFT